MEVSYAAVGGVALISLRNKTPDFGVADDGCNATVTGLNWLERFEVFSKSPVGRQKGLKVEWISKKAESFGFGGDHSTQTLGKVHLHCKIWGESWIIATDVIPGDMPLLVGLPDLGRLDFWIKARDRALWRSGETYETRGFVQELSDSGHILIWLGDDQASSHTALTGSHKRELPRAVTNVCARELTNGAGSKAVRATC